MLISRRAFILGTAAVTLGACSGDDDDSAAPDSAAPDSTAGATEPGTTAPTTTAAPATTAAPTTTMATTTTMAVPPLPEGVFTLGVASGDPLPDSVILWTRLLSDAGDIPAEAVPVTWELAIDDSFAEVVASGTEMALPDHGHSVHAEAGGLDPATEYHYRFTVGEQVSATGRTRTTPAEGDTTTPLAFGFASCQDYQSGYYAAHRDIAEARLDVLFFLGDYIYEYAAKALGEDAAVRQHEGPECTTLPEYRARYATYKRDPLLQASHASCPWVVTWDDHEVENNYADDRSEDTTVDPAAFSDRRAAAYQAWWEHQATRLPAPDSADYTIYRRFQWGGLADVFVLDTRQYRSDQACGDVTLQLTPACPEVAEPGRSLLGETQEAWLFEGLDTSAAVWDVIAQQTVMTNATINGAVLNYDQWDGYPEARQRLLGHLADSGRTNTVVITGDIHLAAVGDLKFGDDGAAATVVGTELVGTSISSQGTLPDGADQLLAQFPDVRYADANYRGWTRCDVTATEWLAEYRIVEDVLVETSPVTTTRRFRITPDTPGATEIV